LTNDLSKINRTTESKGFPDVVLLDNFNGCNLTCSMCDHKNAINYRPIHKMDWKLYTKLVDEIAMEKPGCAVWEIFFGEPFLCNDMAKRIEYAKAGGIKKVLLNSNGVFMTEDRAEKVIQAGLDAIYIGIDAFKEETYNRIRIGGDFKKVINNVIRYKELLDNWGKNQKIFVQFVESEYNSGEVEDFKKFWQEKGIGVKIRPKVSWVGLIQANNLSQDNQTKRVPCYWLMRTINICSDGSVAMCSSDLHCRMKCGDANVSTIKELWNGQLADYRKMHLEGRYDLLHPLCRSCMDWQSTYSETIE
jgi:pyruvate-formate lyase-activating enzyme